MFLLKALVLTLVDVAMAVIASFILVRSRVAFRGIPAMIDLQHSVAAVAIVFCLCNLPCSVVYWWRALLLPKPLSGVPIVLRQMQVIHFFSG